MLGVSGLVQPANGTVAIGPDWTLTYTPDSDLFGVDSFTYYVADGVGASASATVQVTISAVNDPPAFTEGANVTVDEDCGPQTVAGWATVAPAPFGESEQALQFNVTGNTAPALFSVAPVIDSATGDLTFTPAPDAYGSADVTITLSDDAGGDDTSAPVTFTISVTRASPVSVGGAAVVVPAAPADVPRYSKVELLVTLADVAATLFYEPDPSRGGIDLFATFISPTAASHSVNGFYDGADWGVRFAPDEEGPWTFEVSVEDSSGTDTWAGGAFTCTASANPGWVRIDGQYLRHAEGPLFFGVGHNNGWQTDVEDIALADLASRGENLLSFWLATPWARVSAGPPGGEGPDWIEPARAPIQCAELGLDEYNQAACAHLDGVIGRAEAAGVYVLPTIWSHGELRDPSHPWSGGGTPEHGDGWWWYNNAYSSICAAGDFFKMSDVSGETEQWRHQRNLFRYLIARWGYSTALAGWVVVCEINGTSGEHSNPAEADAWCAAVADYFRAGDPNRTNGANQYPIVATKTYYSTWDPGFDMRSLDSYDFSASAIATQTAGMRASGKPAFHAEFGAPHHGGIWAGFASGAAMTPLVWCDGGGFPLMSDPVLGEPMRAGLEILAGFASSTAYLGDPALASAAVSTNAGPACWGAGMMLSDRGFVWIQDDLGSVGGTEVTVSDVADGIYDVDWFDVRVDGTTPYSTTQDVLVSGGSLIVTVPATLSLGDVALRFSPSP
jgi:hypothetical protein